MQPSPGAPASPLALSWDERQRLAAWLSLPEDDGAELLGGRIVYEAMVSLEHGDALVGLSELLGPCRGPRRDGRGGWWLSQDPDLYLAGNGVRPDMAGWRVDKHPTPPRKVNVGVEHLGVYVDPPDWACEVLSETTRRRDEPGGVKWRTYWEAGVAHYWLVDLIALQVTVYARGARDYEPVDIAGTSAVKPLAPFAEVSFDASRLFVLAEAVSDR